MFIWPPEPGSSYLQVEAKIVAIVILYCAIKKGLYKNPKRYETSSTPWTSWSSIEDALSGLAALNSLDFWDAPTQATKFLLKIDISSSSLRIYYSPPPKTRNIAKYDDPKCHCYKYAVAKPTGKFSGEYIELSSGDWVIDDGNKRRGNHLKQSWYNSADAAFSGWQDLLSGSRDDFNVIVVADALTPTDAKNLEELEEAPELESSGEAKLFLLNDALKFVEYDIDLVAKDTDFEIIRGNSKSLSTSLKESQKLFVDIDALIILFKSKTNALWSYASIGMNIGYNSNAGHGHSTVASREKRILFSILTLLSSHKNRSLFMPLPIGLGLTLCGTGGIKASSLGLLNTVFGSIASSQTLHNFIENLATNAIVPKIEAWCSSKSIVQVYYDNWQHQQKRLHQRSGLKQKSMNLGAMTFAHLMKVPDRFLLDLDESPLLTLDKVTPSDILNSHVRILNDKLEVCSSNELADDILMRSDQRIISQYTTILGLPERPGVSACLDEEGKWKMSDIEMIPYHGGCDVGTIRGNIDHIKYLESILKLKEGVYVGLGGDQGCYRMIQRFTTTFILENGKRPWFYAIPGGFHMTEMHFCEAISKLTWKEGLQHMAGILQRGKAKMDCSQIVS